MGGPMYYSRLVGRNGLTGWGYRATGPDDPKAHPGYIEAIDRVFLNGELRRMEDDTFDPDRLTRYGQMAGVTAGEAARLLRTFLGFGEPDCGDCARSFRRLHGETVLLGRCSRHTVY